MKLSTSLLLLVSFPSASAGFTRSTAAKRALLSQSRSLGYDDATTQSEYAFLQSYDIKMIGCKSGSGETYTNPSTGAVEYGEIVYRLCPSNSCSDSSALGCSKGFGDYVVGINTYTENWLTDKGDDMAGDDNFKVQDYGECKNYKVDKNNGGNNNNGNEYYVGPACGPDGDSVILELFTDNACTTPSTDVTFEDISGGWTLPYSDESSPLITTACEACQETNANSGAVQESDMCIILYESATSKCETYMGNTTSSGKDESGCSAIETMIPKAAKTSSAGAAIGWTLLALILVGGAGYAYVTWWMKKKHSGLSSDGAMN